jgi:hypothetical protein
MIRAITHACLRPPRSAGLDPQPLGGERRAQSWTGTRRRRRRARWPRRGHTPAHHQGPPTRPEGRTARARLPSRSPCVLDRSVRDVGGRDLAAGENWTRSVSSGPVPCASRFTNHHDRAYEKDPARILPGPLEVDTRGRRRPHNCLPVPRGVRDVRLLAGCWCC